MHFNRVSARIWIRELVHGPATSLSLRSKPLTVTFCIKATSLRGDSTSKPWDGEPYNRERPEGKYADLSVRQTLRGLLVYLVVEHAREVGVIELMWVG
jgi:hypothetical protein